MNALTKQVLATAMSFAVLASAPAMAITTGSLQGDIQSAISGSGTVNVVVEGRVATLTGNTSNLSRAAVVRAALDRPEIDRVINLIDAS